MELLLTLEGKCLRRRAKPAHFGCHLPLSETHQLPLTRAQQIGLIENVPPATTINSVCPFKTASVAHPKTTGGPKCNACSPPSTIGTAKNYSNPVQLSHLKEGPHFPLSLRQRPPLLPALRPPGPLRPTMGLAPLRWHLLATRHRPHRPRRLLYPLSVRRGPPCGTILKNHIEGKWRDVYFTHQKTD